MGDLVELRFPCGHAPCTLRWPVTRDPPRCFYCGAVAIPTPVHGTDGRCPAELIDAHRASWHCTLGGGHRGLHSALPDGPTWGSSTGDIDGTPMTEARIEFKDSDPEGYVGDAPCWVKGCERFASDTFRFDAARERWMPVCGTHAEDIDGSLGAGQEGSQP